jgi:hypothetical protein
VPVARSDPRRATIIGIAGVIVGVAMIAIVLLANNLGGGSSTTHNSRARFDVGPAESTANAIKRDNTPLFFNDTATGSRPLVIQHFGDDPKTGWVAFDAAIGTCVLTWHPETQDFTDCNGTRYPADGAGLHQYPVTVDQNGELFVDLSLDATTTTTTTITTPSTSS